MAVSRAYGDKTGRDQVQPGHRPGVRGQHRLPGRIDLQGLRRRARHWSRGFRSELIRSSRRTARRSARSRPRNGPDNAPLGPRATQAPAESGHLHTWQTAHRRLGQHLLRPARGEASGSAVPAQIARDPRGAPDRRELRRQAARPGSELVHRSAPTVVSPLVDGRGLRRRSRARGEHCDADARSAAIVDSTGQAPPRAAAPSPASRCSSQEVADGMSQLLQGVMKFGTGGTAGGLGINRPVRGQDRHHRQPTTRRHGSSATRRSCPRPCGSASRRRRRCDRWSSTAATTGRCTARASPPPSGSS